MLISAHTKADYMLYNVVLCSDHVNSFTIFRFVRCNIELLYVLKRSSCVLLSVLAVEVKGSVICHQNVIIFRGTITQILPCYISF